MEHIIGRFARSAAGHDKDCRYVIIRTEGAYVYLCDGKYHTLEKMKKKSLKHVIVCETGVEPQLLQKIINNAKIFDYEIKCAIKNQQ